MIDFDNSYVDFISSKNSWRTNIKSYLKSDKKEYFLVKECRGELVGKNPFQHPGRYEFLSIVEENGKTHISRISSVHENKETLMQDSQYGFMKDRSVTDACIVCNLIIFLHD